VRQKAAYERSRAEGESDTYYAHPQFFESPQRKRIIFYEHSLHLIIINYYV
jgi:hypothetical protein